MTQSIPLDPSPNVQDLRDQLRAAEKTRLSRRKLVNVFVAGLVTSSAFFSVAVLLIILIHIFLSGIGAINIAFFTQEPKPVGETGGGIANAIIGTILMVFFAALAAIPLGLGTAILLSEYGRGRFAKYVRFSLDLLAGLPSIVVGMFIWGTLVTTHVFGYSGWAGSIALVVIMIPIMARSVEEILHLVPDTYREAALALGTPHWKVITRIVIPTVRPGIVTGIFLGLARAAGETAPLLMTAFGSQYINFQMNQPMSAIPLQAYQYSGSAYPEQVQQAWGAVLVLVVLVAVFSTAVRYITGRIRVEY